MEKQTTLHQLRSFKSFKPFWTAALAWLVLGGGFLVFWHPGKEIELSLSWFGLLWAVVLIDLYALARVLLGVLELLSPEKETNEKFFAQRIQTFYWGLIKLACVGILMAILYRGAGIPKASLLLGISTLVFVPLLGGYLWSQKVLRDA